MFIVIWEYQVNAKHLAQFESIYASNGTWAELFKKGKGYLGTELLCDEQDPCRFLTIDRWASVEEYDAFITKWHSEYQALDAKCEGLTEHEALVGRWSSQE